MSPTEELQAVHAAEIDTLKDFIRESQSRIADLEQALREAQLVLKMSHQLPIRVDHLRWWLHMRDKTMDTIKAALGDGSSDSEISTKPTFHQ